MLSLPRLAWQELTLAPDDIVTRGEEHDDRPLADLIALGGPTSIPITADDVADDGDAVAFVRARAQSFSFFLVHLACAFRPLDGEPFLTATVQLDLSRGDGVASPAPIALSMKPDRLGEPVELSRSVKLGATLKILEAGAEQVVTTTYEDPFLEALNELRSDPCWQLHRTRHIDIRGSQRFVMVVQAPLGSDARGSVTLSAEVKRKRFGIVSYAAALSDQRPLEFVLGQ